jgi:hypothetical protein
MRLTEIVVKEAIIADLQADNKADAIRLMVKGLREAGKIREADEEPILGAILKREELDSISRVSMAKMYLSCSWWSRLGIDRATTCVGWKRLPST